jgi:hypothetical protein
MKDDLLTFGYGSWRFLSEFRIRLDPDPRPGLWIRIGSVFNDFVNRLGIRIQGMGFRMGSKFNDIVDPDPIVVNPDP